MKMIVETTGSFALLDPYNGDYIAPNRPSVAHNNEFIVSRIALGQIKLLVSDLSDKATNKGLLEYLGDSDGDVELAVASFASSHKPSEKPLTKAQIKAAAKAEAKAKAKADEGVE